MLGSTAEPPPSPPPAHAPDVGVHLRAPPAPDHAPDTGVDRPPPSPPVAVTAPPPPHAPVPVAAAEGEKKRPPNAPPKKRLRSPLVPLVGSPGINIILSQSSPRTIGVKRPSPEPAANPSHLYFHELWKIHLKLEREAIHGEKVIKSMVEAMRKKFTKYWKLSYVNICLPVILDPRYKFKFLEFCLKAGFETEVGKCLAKVKKTFKDLFVEYSSHDGDSMEYDEGDTSAAASIDNPWAEWKERTKEQQKQRAKMSELDIYLKDEICQQEDDFDILYWWSANAQKYPVLSRIAKDVLAAPVSSVASESAFSTGGRVLSDYRSRLLSSTVEALICLQDWMRPRGSSRVSTVTSDLIYAKNNVDGRDTDIFGD